MIRTFAFGLGCRLSGYGSGHLSLWHGHAAHHQPVAAFWLGWISSLLGAEYWIRHTRRPLSTHLAASVGFVELAQQGAPADGLASRAAAELGR